MPYLDREPQLRFTLRTIAASPQAGFGALEVIIVDDASPIPLQISPLDYPFPIRVIRIEPENKHHTNPVIPFNTGIRQAKGQIIVMQSPECCHVGDLLTYIQTHLTDENYISMACFAASHATSQTLRSIEPTQYLFQRINDVIGVKRESTPDWEGDQQGWYNHPVFRPVGYHFLSAITRKNMSKLNGFDERYAAGVGYDDDDLILRINRLGLQIEIPIGECLYCVHQFHSQVPVVTFGKSYWLHNEMLLQQARASDYYYAPNRETIPAEAA
jgi:hypothetical protein